MSANRPEDFRNVALAGPAGSGKTTLTEVILHRCGVITRAGSIDDGSTVCDHDPLEKEFKRSLDSAVVQFEADDLAINLIDTPGSPDFLGRSISALPAVETVFVVLDVDGGVDPVARRIFRIAAERRLPRMIIVNKIDHGADLAALYESIRTAFGDACLPVNLPTGGGTGVIDCFKGTEGDSDLGSVAEFHTKIIDQVVEVDEALMARYLEGEAPTPEQMHAPFEKALREAHLVPILFTSATTGVGVPELLDAIEHLCPSPVEGNPRSFEGNAADESPIELEPNYDPDAPLLAHVFKVAADPFVGKLSVFKVHQGRISSNAQPLVDDGRKSVRLSHLFRLQGGKHVEVKELVAGDIGAVAKIEEIHFNSVLHDGALGQHLHLKPLPLPRPMHGLAIEPKKTGAESKLADALSRMTAEDPTFESERVLATHELVIRGLGELHLRMKLRRLAEQYGLEVDSHPPRVAYKETITKAAEGHHRHKKQTGGAGQFGEVFLRVEPTANGDFEFVDETVGGSVPRQFLPAIEKGVRQVLSEGAVAGYPLQGVRVAVYDGKHHPVDSKEIAFITAGKKAFIDAVQKSAPVLLEPIAALEITVPDDAIGDIAADLSGRRGRLVGTDVMGPGVSLIHAEAPLSEVTDYEGRLRSMTGGSGSYTMSYSHDEPTPQHVQQQIVAEFQPKADED